MKATWFFSSINEPSLCLLYRTVSSVSSNSNEVCWYGSLALCQPDGMWPKTTALDRFLCWPQCEVMIESLVPTKTFRKSHTDHLFDRRRTNTCDSFSGTLNQVKKSTWWEPNFAEFTHCSHFLRSCLICIFHINTMQLAQEVSSIYSVPSFRLS